MAGAAVASNLAQAAADDVFSWVKEGIDWQERDRQFDFDQEKWGIEKALTEAQTEKIREEVIKSMQQRKWFDGLSKVAGQRGLGMGAKSAGN